MNCAHTVCTIHLHQHLLDFDITDCDVKIITSPKKMPSHFPLLQSDKNYHIMNAPRSQCPKSCVSSIVQALPAQLRFSIF